MLVLNDFNTSVQKALSEIDPKWRDYDGLIVCGTHTPLNVESMIEAIKVAREENKPVLGICFGFQLCAIEYARNVLGIKDATSEELGVPGTFVVVKRPEMKVGLHDGESWWSNYDVTQEIKDKWTTGSNFFVTGSHPEYQSSVGKPHPLLVSFLKYAKNA